MLKQDQLVRLSEARRALRDIGESERSIDEVAKAAAMSRFHFIRQFKSVFGVTPVQYRTRARLDRAKDLLAHSEASITDICMTVGFSSLGSFSALFAARIKQSPSAYRAACRASALPAAPACMELLQAVWASESQISRSAKTAASSIDK